MSAPQPVLQPELRVQVFSGTHPRRNSCWLQRSRYSDTASKLLRGCSRAGIEQAIVCSDGRIAREDLWIQIKFAPLGAQTLKGVLPPNMPYDPEASLEEMVAANVHSSLRLLGVASLDAVLLHEPLHVIDDTMRAWNSLESFVPDKIRYLGVSNTDLATLRQIYERATIKPAIVQSRFTLIKSATQESYGFQLRQFCKEKGILYRPFLVLKANPHLLKSSFVRNLAAHFEVTPEQMLFSLVGSLHEHVAILNSTTQDLNKHF
ncbi:NADP-dependent oxidoreductase domain-containing protein [Leptodontidium sp. 2 PMI_412]|nr:NADP-dependent oxidoreductase domain-containing protein [Leptodontidium sp. MPI-SDFR-AT-0119]KAH9203456.1 NADP-dependent oxidoreductase domain-containing protein [Leptodontidium sp. 2 PMI_412]